MNQVLQRIRDEISKVVIGQNQAIEYALITILCRQHALLEGVPGVGKTLLVKTIARALGRPHSRVQFTPDLMPSDITGTSVFDLQTQKFNLVRGPVFTSFLLADEINRAPAKTQAALLQAMQERCVTIDRDTWELPVDFTVFATQNPIEHEGTYPLPEAQKDRFFMCIQMEAPPRDEELRLAHAFLQDAPPEILLNQVQPCVAESEWDALRTSLLGIHMREEIIAYALDLVRRCRLHASVLHGAGPRATQALLLAARAQAALESRDYVIPDDVKSLAVPVLAHRMGLRPEFEMEGATTSEIIDCVCQEIPVPK